MMRRICYIFCILSGVLISCRAPVGPEEPGASAQKSDEKQTIDMQLWAGRIKYAAYMGGHEWRATFEARVMVDSTENIRDQCRIKFFWKSKLTEPTVDETGWISFPGRFKHGLMSIDGIWLDRLPPSPPPEAYWMRAQVMSARFDTIDIIGMCNFLESVEHPDATWNSAEDFGYGLGDRILASQKVTIK